MEVFRVAKNQDCGPKIQDGLWWSHKNDGRRVLFEFEDRTPQLRTPVDIEEQDLRVHATFDLGRPIDLRIPSGRTGMRFGGLRYSVLDGLKAMLVHDDTRAFDFGGKQGSSSRNHIVRPFVGCNAGVKNCEAIRVGDKGDDYSSFHIESPTFRFPLGSPDTDPKAKMREVMAGGFVGIQWTGGNNMAHLVTDVSAIGCATVFRSLPKNGQSAGGKAVTYVGGTWGWCGTVFAVDAGFGMAQYGGRGEHIACLLTHGNPFGAGKGRGEIEIRNVEVGDPLPYWNEELLIGKNGAVIALNSAGNADLKVKLYDWRGEVPSSPILRHSSDRTAPPVISTGYVEPSTRTAAL